MDTGAVVSGCRTTKIYCRPDCPAGKRMKTENRIFFSSRNEARVNGYRACKVCNPDSSFRVRETLFFSRYPSPLGTYIVAGSKRGTVCLKTEEQTPRFAARWESDGIELRGAGQKNIELRNQLDEYFAGKRRRFTIPLDLRGTRFQRLVWDLLCAIPFGETRTYGEIAEATGRPLGARAVGRAVGTNPVSIVVPCHRIIGANGAITGYGGGLDRKRALLKLEGIEIT